MLVNILVSLLASATALALPLTERDATSDTLAALKAANNAVERNAIIAKGGNASFGFDFNNPPTTAAVVSGSAGQVVIADGSTFPASFGQEIAVAVFTVQPCAMILPHTHPRSPEFAIVTEGSIITQFIGETGDVVVTNNLTSYQSVLFPKGSIHYEYNPTCATSKFIGSFNSGDPGTSFIVANFLSLNESQIVATLGGDSVVSGQDVDSLRTHIPTGLATGVQACLTKCGLKPYTKRSVAEVLSLK
jgi:oxalate decarboxylase/phosphoglucose isomerase-like protein (cupin superfamily)